MSKDVRGELVACFMIPYISIQRLRKITEISVRTTDYMAEIWIMYLTDASNATVYTYLLRFYTNKQGNLTL
jgi:hypothetical protein